MEKIKFSILIPVYNVEKYLKKCLDSVLNQTYGNFEVILIEDGSTDNSGKICDDYSKIDNRIKVYHQNNRGVSRTRYEGMKHIKGLFTLFLDSDDYWEKNLLEVINKVIERTNVDLIIFNDNYVGENNKFLFKNKSGFKDNKIFVKDSKIEIYKKIFFTDEINTLWKKAIKTSLINLENYKEYLNMGNGEDNMFSVPLLIKAEKIINIDKALYNYRQTPNSITTNFKESKIKDEFMRRKYSLLYLEKLGLDSKNNFKLLNNLYIQKMLVHVFNLGCSNEKANDKLRILNNMRAFYLKKKELDLFEEKNMKTYLKIIYFLYKFNFKRLIFLYIYMVKSLINFKKLIKNIGN